MLGQVNGMFNKYMEFFATFNVLGLAIGLMIGSNLKDVAGDFIDDVLMPVINPAINVFTQGKGVTLHIPGTGIKINLEPVQWVSVRNWSEMKGKKKSGKNFSI